MDSKITKKRLSNFLAYEWFYILCIIVAAIIGWEFIYSFSSVKLTVGQEFVYYYDSTISASDIQGFYELFGYNSEDKEKRAFSYDIKNFYCEIINEDYNVLGLRLSIYLGDVLFTDAVPKEEGMNNADGHISNDNYPVYDLEEFRNDGKAYLSQFLADDKQNENPFVYTNLSEEKIETYFLNRLKFDNRLRAGEISVEDEKDRIQKLCKSFTKFAYLLDNHSEIFYISDVKEEGSFKKYGILPEKLLGGEKDASLYFKTANINPQNPDQPKYSIENTVILTYNFTRHQPDLQFETVNFLIRVVEKCSNLLDNYEVPNI